MARILIVDDSPTEVKKISTILEKHKHEVLTADNGADGVAKARAETPDLVLMDIHLPGMNGYQALDAIQKDASLRHIPVVALSANAMERDRAHGLAAGFADYLTKPLDIDQLSATLSRYVSTDAIPRKAP